MMPWFTLAPSTIFVAWVSPPPPPPPAARVNWVMAAPLLFFSVTVCVPSSPSSTSLSNRVALSISLNLPATARFSTGFVLWASRLASTVTSSTVRSMLPWASGVFFWPFSVTLFTVPPPPKSSQLLSLSQLVRLVPTNCFVCHLPWLTSKVTHAPFTRFFSSTALMAVARV